MTRLTPAQIERLAKFSEEIGEVTEILGRSQKIIGKVLLHGYSAMSRDGVPYDNKGDLEKEIGDLLAALDLITGAGDLDPVKIDTQRAAKSQTITYFMDHQSDKTSV